MMLKTMILSGAAATALAMAAANVAVAQTYDSRYGNGPQASSPAEAQETNDLNQQALSGTTQSPAALNGQEEAQYGENAPVSDGASPPPGPYDQGSPYTKSSRYSPQDAQYEAQQQQYQDQVQRYQGQQQRYQYDRQRYDQDVRAYDLAQYAWSYPEPYVYRYGEESGLQPLYLLAEPSQQLWQVPVEGPGGRWVGRVRNVQTAPDGRPWRVEIALNRRVSVWVQPGDLRFDPSEDILYTDLSRSQLWTMPGATIESAPL